MPYNSKLPGLKIRTSSQPLFAPSNYRQLPLKEVLEDDGEAERWRSCGLPTTLKCESCGHGGEGLTTEDRNIVIYYYDNTQRNGNYCSRSEIECSKCGIFSTIETWEEG